MYDAFSSKPDLRPYTAIRPQQSLGQTTTAAQARAAGPLAAQLPFGQRDLVPQALFDRVLWRSVRGHVPAPTAGPHASREESARARGADAAARRGDSMQGWLKAHSDSD